MESPRRREPDGDLFWTMHANVLSGQRAMKNGDWQTYRTRFLVKAKRLSSNLSFVDHLGRQHSGRKGDYLVESSDGVISITPRQIFEDVYVPLAEDAMDHRGTSVRFATRVGDGRTLPQPCCDRRGSTPRMGVI